MKHCPECNRNYADPTLSYCLDDGASLVYGPAVDEPETAILTSGDLTGEAVIRRSGSATRQPQAATRSNDSRTKTWWKAKPILLFAGLAFLVVAGVVTSRYFVASGGSQIDSVAVLPFENGSNDPEMEYLSDGIAESLMYRLSQLPRLKVSPRSLVFRFKGTTDDPIKVGNQLGVGAVVSGRLVQHGDDLNVSVELVDVRSRRIIWGEQYARKTSDLLQTQREIARQISEKLKQVSGDDNALTKPYTVSNEAYQLYLKGRFYWYKRNADAIRKAVEYYSQAIEKDPNFALSYAGLADAYLVFPIYSISFPDEAIPKAKAMARRALDIDDSLAEAHTTLGAALVVYDRNLPEADREFQRAFELNPNYPEAHHWYGSWYLTAEGRLDEGITEIQRAIELDPLSMICYSDLGRLYIYERQYDVAIEQLQKAIEMDSTFYLLKMQLGLAYSAKGNYDAALAEFNDALNVSDDPRLPAYIAYALAKSGKRDEAERRLEQLNQSSKQRFVSPVSLSYVYLALGDRDKAFESLERAYKEHDAWIVRIKTDPFLEPLRDDPRLQALITKYRFQL
jgi:TolB-like protein/Tfp pilus assembly protein PilF